LKAKIFRDAVPFLKEIGFLIFREEGKGGRLKLSAASCGESSILKRNKPFRFCSLTPRQAAGNALAGGFKTEREKELES
jgi:hypothetical protein